MATIDDFFLAHGLAFSGFNTFLTRNGNPSFTVGVAGFGNRAGVYGQTEIGSPPNLVAGVYGTATTQPGVIGFSREGDGAQGASFAGTAFRAVSFFGPGVHSLSGALTGVTGISGTDGPPVPSQPIAGVLGSSADRPGVIGTSGQVGIVGFSNNIGIVGQTTNPASFAGVFLGNVLVNGTLTANAKNSVVTFPDGTQRVLHCMESPEHWFEDFGTAKLKRGRTIVKLDSDFAKLIQRDYRVFLTPEGDCRGLYVRKSATKFEVREVHGGRSNVGFSYRIVGRRRDITRHRRFAKIDTRPPVLGAAAPASRKKASRSSVLRAFVAKLEKEARARAPEGVRKAAQPFPRQLKREAVNAAAALGRRKEGPKRAR